MGLVFSVCELLIYRKCDCLTVVDDMALYPPFPYCRLFYTFLYTDTVLEIDNKLALKYGAIMQSALLPSSMSVKFIPLDTDNHLCLVHFKSPSSKYELEYFQHLDVLLYTVTEMQLILAAVLITWRFLVLL